MSAPLKTVGWLAAGTVLAVALGWYYWSSAGADAGNPPTVLEGANADAARRPSSVAASPPPEAESDGVTAKVEPHRSASEWDSVKLNCPWPPDASSWAVLGRPCLEAMDAVRNGRWDHELRSLLDDARGTRRAVAVALGDAQCHVPAGQSRPDLREACAADAMVRLARLQSRCMVMAHMDWERAIAKSAGRAGRVAALRGGSQEEYIRAVEERNSNRAHSLWEVYMCRSEMDALEWLEALPRPPGNLANAGLEVYDPEFIGAEEVIDAIEAKLGVDDLDDWGLVDPVAPRITQSVELYALARSLGAKLPDSANRMLELHGPAARD